MAGSFGQRQLCRCFLSADESTRRLQRTMDTLCTSHVSEEENTVLGVLTCTKLSKSEAEFCDVSLVSKVLVYFQRYCLTLLPSTPRPKNRSQRLLFLQASAPAISSHSWLELAARGLRISFGFYRDWPSNTTSMHIKQSKMFFKWSFALLTFHTS